MNRCKRCNRLLSNDNAEYGWRCAELLGIKNPSLRNVSSIAVQNNQKVLNSYGYKDENGKPLREDGILDEQTENAINAIDLVVTEPQEMIGKDAWVAIALMLSKLGIEGALINTIVATGIAGTLFAPGAAPAVVSGTIALFTTLIANMCYESILVITAIQLAVRDNGFVMGVISPLDNNALFDNIFGIMYITPLGE